MLRLPPHPGRLVSPRVRVTRRSALAGALGLTLARRALAADEPSPVLYVSHGSPLFLPGNDGRRAELVAWGSRLPRPRGIVAMTPHVASRRLELGPIGPGVALYDLPRAFRSLIPPNLGYATPPNDDLARLVEGHLGGPSAVVKSARPGFDHTTWMPLSCLFPRADVPTIELSYPYVRDRDLFELGRRLAPLRDEGITFVASGQVTHNLAMFDPAAAAPPWARDFDAWTSERVVAEDVDALIDWRSKAPAVDLAHPDDGGHYRVLLVALGVAVGGARVARRVTFPVTGFEASMSKRCIELGA